MSSIVTQHITNLNNSMVISPKVSRKDQTHNSLIAGANIKLMPINKSKFIITFNSIVTIDMRRRLDKLNNKETVTNVNGEK
jgi:hypothetical protein